MVARRSTCILAVRCGTDSDAHGLHRLQVLQMLRPQLHLLHPLLELVVVFYEVFCVGTAHATTTTQVIDFGDRGVGVGLVLVGVLH